MASVTIFGTGAMGTAIGDLLAGGDTQVRHVSRSDDATLTDDIVVLAVPYESLDEIARKYRDQLSGKIVVDITNPLDFDTFDSLKVPAGSSAAAQLQNALPDATVLKAFNTTFSATLESKRVGPNTTTVLVAGDDSAAKNTLISAIAAADVNAMDAGPLERAHELEALGFLQLTLANDKKIDWSGGFGVVV